MGTADALPGVSGGTVALLLGFYGRLIAAVTAFTPRRAVTILRGYRPERRDRAREALLELDFGFLLPLGVGMATAVVLIADLVSTLAESHPVAMFGFFTGLIAASAITLGRSLTFTTPLHAGTATAGAGLALLVAADLVTLRGRSGRDPRRRRDRRQRDDPAGNLRFAHPDTARPVHLPLLGAERVRPRARRPARRWLARRRHRSGERPSCCSSLAASSASLPSPASCVSRWPATAS